MMLLKKIYDRTPYKDKEFEIFVFIGSLVLEYQVAHNRHDVIAIAHLEKIGKQ